MSEDPIDIRIVSNLLLVFFLNSFLMTAYFKFTKFFLANLVFLKGYICIYKKFIVMIK